MNRRIIGIVFTMIMLAFFSHGRAWAAPAPPSITGSSGSTSGLPAGGTVLTIYGTGFATASGVTFGSTPAAAYTIISDTQITVTSPPGSLGGVNIYVTNPDGTNSPSLLFTYANPPTITGVSPANGPTGGGTPVTVTGTDLNCSAVKVGATYLTSWVVGGTTVTFTSPAGSAGTVDIVCTTAGGDSATSANSKFTYNPPPSVSSVSPEFGVTAGGTAVTITGAQFTGATGVLFGSAPATGFTVVSDSQITATATAGAVGSVVDVTVTNINGTSATHEGDKYSYGDPVTITSISPSSGSTAGSYTVTITGTNFPVSLIRIFAVDSFFTRDSDTQITASILAGPAGTYDLQLLSPFGDSVSSAASKFTLVAPAAITGISPSTGLTTGGTSVVITGAGFTGATAVTFGTTAATSFTVDSATQITAISPARPMADTPHITVTIPVGGASAIVPADQFTYTTPPPTISGITPSTGRIAGGTSVTITGTNLYPATAVKFGSSNAASYTVNSSTQIIAIVPACAAGTVDITVTTPSGTSAVSTADQFTYSGLPVVSHIDTSTGPISGGTSIRIYGYNFTGATAVKFGGSNAASYTIGSDSIIDVTSPPGSVGPVDITVTTSYGASAASAADQFTYHNHPGVTGISPSSGTLAGGTQVVISGYGFSGATGVDAVKFGGSNAAGYTVDSDSQITAITPAVTVSTVDVTVTTPAGGTSPLTVRSNPYYPSEDEFTFNNAFGAADGTYDFGSLGDYGSKGLGYAALGDKFKVENDAYEIWPSINAGAFTALYPNNGVTTSYTAIIKAEGGATCKSFTFKDLGISAAAPGQSFTSLDIVLKDAAGAQLGSTISLGASPVYSDSSVTNLSTLYGQGPWAIDNVAAIEITYVLAGGLTSDYLNLENITLANVSAPAAAPVIFGVSPSLGSTAGGTAVTITGADFSGVTGVSFGGVPAASFTYVSPTQITAVSPVGIVGIVGNVDITVTTGLGTNALSADDHFTYLLPPTITGISPSSGTAAGGDMVTITGTGLAVIMYMNPVILGGTVVKFGGIAAGNVIFDSSTQIRAISPAGSPGMVDITVTGLVASTTGAADRFTYLPLPLPPATPTTPTTPATTTVTPGGTATIGSSTTPVNAGAGSTLTITSGTSGATINLPTPPTTGATATNAVNVMIGGNNLSVRPTESGSVIKTATVTIDGHNTTVLNVTAGSAMITSSHTDQPLLAIGSGSSAIVVTGGSVGSEATSRVNSVTGNTTLSITSGTITLPSNAFDEVGNGLATIKDGKLYAGEVAVFNSADKISSVHLGSMEGGTTNVGDLVQAASIAGLTMNVVVPNLNGIVARVSDTEDFGGVIVASMGTGFTFQGQNSSGILSLDFPGGSAKALPTGAITVDTSRADGMSFTDNGTVEVVKNGVIVSFVPTVSDNAQFAEQIAALDNNGTVTVNNYGVLQATISGITYALQPAWVVNETSGDAIPGFTMDEQGHVVYRDSIGNQQVLYPVFVNSAQLVAAFKTYDTNASITGNGDGTVTTNLLGVTYTLMPDYALTPVPAEHANDAWWLGTDDKVYIKSTDGTKAQGSEVK